MTDLLSNTSYVKIVGSYWSVSITALGTELFADRRFQIGEF